MSCYSIEVIARDFPPHWMVLGVSHEQVVLHPGYFPVTRRRYYASYEDARRALPRGVRKQRLQQGESESLVAVFTKPGARWRYEIHAEDDDARD